MIWVGPKESDIYFDRGYFSSSVTICGSGTNGNQSRSALLGKRENYNSDSFSPGSFFNDVLNSMIIHDAEEKIMFYNSQLAYAFDREIYKHAICINEYTVLEFLNNKSDLRLWASNYIPVVPYVTVENADSLKAIEPGMYVVQNPHSSGGYGTIFFDHTNDLHLKENTKYIVSKYYAKAIPCNINLIIYDNDILLFPPSIQIIHRHEDKLLYLGADYYTFGKLSGPYKEKLRTYSLKIANEILKLNYRGILGLDFLIVNNDVLLLEVNPRFQASTFLLSPLLKANGLPSAFELNYQAFTHFPAPSIDFYDDSTSGSSLSYIKGTEQNAITAINRKVIDDTRLVVLWDGYKPSDECESGAYMFKLIFPDGISSITSENRVEPHQNLITLSNTEQAQVIKNTPTIVRKIALLNQGVFFSPKVSNPASAYRTGVHSAIDISLNNEIIVNCPINLKYSHFTPFQIDQNEDGSLFLSFYSQQIGQITLPSSDAGQLLKTTAGTPYSDYAFWATDRLRIHHSNCCTYKSNKLSCSFCNASGNSGKFNFMDIEEITDYYVGQKGIKHYLVGGGSAQREIESSRIIEIVKLLRSKSKKEIYVMCLPVQSESTLQQMYSAGVTQIAFNIEIFNRELAKLYMPGKGSLSVETYLESLNMATKIWGRTGNVRTLFVAGLEPMESLLNGIEVVASLGVQPILSAFRPLPGTALFDLCPPTNLWLFEAYEKANRICSKHGVTLGPDCPDCRNNTVCI